MPADNVVPPPLHELEAEVMDEVWRHDETTGRAISEALNARAEKPRAYTTYMTTMSRLHAKGLLTRRREGQTDIYRAVYTAGEYADLRAAAEVDSVIAQFGDLALSHFARQMAQLDPERRAALPRLARKS